MLAARNGYPAIVEKLIEASTNVNTQDNKYGVTAEDMAIKGHKEIAEVLQKQRVSTLNEPNVTLQQGSEERGNATCF